MNDLKLKIEQPATGFEVVEFQEMEFQQVIAAVQNYADFLNEEFKPWCEKLGISANMEGLKSLMNKSGATLEAIISNLVSVELDKSGMHPSLKAIATKNQAKEIRQFADVIERATKNYNFISHLMPQDVKRSIVMLDCITFVDGAALVTESTKEAISQIFTTYLDTDNKAMALNLMTAITDSITSFNIFLLSQGKYFDPIEMNNGYISTVNGTAEPRKDTIKYF